MPSRPPSARPSERKPWGQPSSAAHKRIRGRKGVELRERIRREEPLCRACLAEGRVSPTTQVDHILGLARGGTNDRPNLQGLCDEHHLAKTVAETPRGGAA